MLLSFERVIPAYLPFSLLPFSLLPFSLLLSRSYVRFPEASTQMPA